MGNLNFSFITIFKYFRLVNTQPSVAIYFLREKSLTYIEKLINYFSPGLEMSKIINSPKVESHKASELVSTIHSYFAEFRNKCLPLKEEELIFNQAFSRIENCEIGIEKIKKILRLIRDFIYYPTIHKISTLFGLSKLTQDLIECIVSYVKML